MSQIPKPNNVPSTPTPKPSTPDAQPQPSAPQKPEGQPETPKTQVEGGNKPQNENAPGQNAGKQDQAPKDDTGNKDVDPKKEAQPRGTPDHSSPSDRPDSTGGNDASDSGGVGSVGAQKPASQPGSPGSSQSSTSGPPSSKDMLRNQRANRSAPEGEDSSSASDTSKNKSKNDPHTDGEPPLPPSKYDEALNKGFDSAVGKDLDQVAGSGATDDLRKMVSARDEDGDRMTKAERGIYAAKNLGRAANAAYAGNNKYINKAIDKAGDGLTAGVRKSKRTKRELNNVMSGKALMDAVAPDAKNASKQKRGQGLSSGLTGGNKGKKGGSGKSGGGNQTQSGKGEAGGQGIAKKAALAGAGVFLVVFMVVSLFFGGGMVSPFDGQPDDDSDQSVQGYIPGDEEGGWYEVATWSVSHQNFDRPPSQIPWPIIMGIAAEQTDFGRYSPYDAIDRDPDREVDQIITPQSGSGGSGGSGNVNIQNTGDMDRTNPAWRQQVAMEGLVSAGYTPEQSAGMVGNMITESGVEPTQHEIGYPFPSDRGWGLVQWTFGRNTTIVNKVRNELGDKFYTNDPSNLSDDEWVQLLELQLDHVIWELNNSHATVGQKIRNASTVTEASNLFLEEYEIPADIPGNRPIRAAQSEEVLRIYNAGGVDAIGDGNVAVNITPEEAEWLTFNTEDHVRVEMTATQNCPVPNPDPAIGGDEGEGVGPYLLTPAAAEEARNDGFDPNSPCVGRWIADKLADHTRAVQADDYHDGEPFVYHDNAPWPYGDDDDEEDLEEEEDTNTSFTAGIEQDSNDPLSTVGGIVVDPVSNTEGEGAGDTEDGSSDDEELSDEEQQKKDFEDNVAYWEAVILESGLFADRNEVNETCELAGGEDDDTNEAYSQQIIYSFHCEIAKQSRFEVVTNAAFSTPAANASEDEIEDFEAEPVFSQLNDRYEAESRVIQEALQVSYTSSNWNLNQCDASAERAGLFMLTAEEMQDAGYDADERCDSAKSAAAAAKLFMAGESEAVDDRPDDDGPFQPALGGWDNISVAVGTEDREDFIMLGSGSGTPHINDECRADMEDWVEHVASNDNGGGEDGPTGFSDWASEDDPSAEDQRKFSRLGHEWSDEHQGGGIFGRGKNPPHLQDSCPGGSSQDYAEILGEIAASMSQEEDDEETAAALDGYANWAGWVRNSAGGTPEVGVSSLVDRLSVYSYDHPTLPLSGDNLSRMILNEIGGRDGFVPIHQRAVEYAIFFGGLSQPFDTAEKIYGSLEEAAAGGGGPGGDGGNVGIPGNPGDVDAEGCPTEPGPHPGAMTGGSEAIGINELCKRSVEQARSPEAAVALKWAFQQVGNQMYSQPKRMTATHSDCSSLISRAYQEGAGLRLYQPGGNAWTTRTFSGGGTNQGAPTVSQSELMPGDWFMTSPGHIVMVISDGYVLHASRPGTPIKIDPMYQGSYNLAGYIDPNAFEKLDHHDISGGGGSDSDDD